MGIVKPLEWNWSCFSFSDNAIFQLIQQFGHILNSQPIIDINLALARLNISWLDSVPLHSMINRVVAEIYDELDNK